MSLKSVMTRLKGMAPMGFALCGTCDQQGVCAPRQLFKSAVSTNFTIGAVRLLAIGYGSSLTAHHRVSARWGGHPSVGPDGQAPWPEVNAQCHSSSKIISNLKTKII